MKKNLKNLKFENTNLQILLEKMLSSILFCETLAIAWNNVINILFRENLVIAK